MPRKLTRDQFEVFLQVLKKSGYTVVGPRLRDAAIVYDEIEKIDDLPAGWTEEQGPGFYRIKKRSDNALFGYNVGPHSWKKYLFPPEEKLLQATQESGKLVFEACSTAPRRLAFLGVRACELHAIEIQDRVFLKGDYVDDGYRKRRENIFIIALNCSTAAATCFCTSMKTGPKAEAGFDLALTEIIEAGRHFFVLEMGSTRGAELVEKLDLSEATSAEQEQARERVELTAAQISKTLDTTNIRELFAQNMEHPRWDDVASRCISCTNCTMVCPTCFCSTVEDVTDLGGASATRVRKWDSCYSLDFSYIHGGSVRSSIKSRYRQWLSHKLATWIDQFGTSGCVGCGRCITWCPVGIDLTEEVRALRAPVKGESVE